MLCQIVYFFFTVRKTYMDMIFAINQWVPVYYIYAFSFLGSHVFPLCGAYIGFFVLLLLVLLATAATLEVSHKFSSCQTGRMCPVKCPLGAIEASEEPERTRRTPGDLL